MRHRYEVIVGNIGTVYQGSSKLFALRRFNEYRNLSDIGYGRASEESITMLTDDEITAEHIGAQELRECVL